MGVTSIQASVRAVDTIAAMQALVPEPGQSVFCLGAAAAGDGGGGLFRATSGAERTDGGIVFGCTADESSLVQTTKVHADFQSDLTLAANLVFGSVSIGSGSYVLTDLNLHGHNASNHTLTAWLNHATGVITGSTLYNWVGRVDGYGDGPGTSVPVSYKTLGNARRWVRVWDGHTIDFRWWAPATDANVANKLRWCLTTAKRLGARRVTLGGGTWLYGGMVEVPDGVELCDGKLKVADSYILDHFVNAVETSTQEQDKLPEWTVNCATGWVGPECSAATFTLRRLELDGNIVGNEAAVASATTDDYWGNSNGSSAETTNYLQNTPTWGGVYITDHNSRTVADPTRCVLDDVRIHDYGSTCLLGHGYSTWSVSGLRLKNSAWNHLFYSLKGDIKGLVLEGYAWGSYGKSEHVYIEGMHAENLTANPYRSASLNIFNMEGLDYGDGEESSSHRYRRLGVSINRFHIDLPDGVTITPIFAGLGSHFRVGDGVVLGRPDDNFTLLKEVGNGYQTGLNKGWSADGVTVFLRGAGCQVLDAAYADSLTVRGASVLNLRGYATPATTGLKADRYFAAYATTRAGEGWAEPQETLVEGVVSRVAQSDIALWTDVVESDADPITVRFRGCHLYTASNVIVGGPDGTGRWASLTNDLHDLLRFRFEGCTLSVGADTTWTNLELLFATARFRDCRNVAGLRSEDEGAVSFTATGGETYRDVSTNLWWWGVPTANGAWTQATGRVALRPLNSATDGKLTGRVWFHNAGTDIASVDDKRSPTMRVYFTSALSNGDAVSFHWRAEGWPL